MYARERRVSFSSPSALVPTMWALDDKPGKQTMQEASASVSCTLGSLARAVADNRQKVDGDFALDCDLSTARDVTAFADVAAAATHPLSILRNKRTVPPALSVDSIPSLIDASEDSDITDADDPFSDFAWSAPSSPATSSVSSAALKPNTYRDKGLPDPQLAVDHSLHPLPVLVITDMTDNSSFTFQPSEGCFPVMGGLHEAEEFEIEDEGLLDPTEHWRELIAWRDALRAIEKTKPRKSTTWEIGEVLLSGEDLFAFPTLTEDLSRPAMDLNSLQQWDLTSGTLR